jgi:hypothetical protein
MRSVSPTRSYAIAPSSPSGGRPHHLHERPEGQSKFLDSIKVYTCSLVSSLPLTLRLIVHLTFTRNEYNADLTPIYHQWITDRVDIFNSYIVTGMNNMISWWTTTGEVGVREDLANQELGSLTVADRLSLDMAASSQITTVQLRKYQGNNSKTH